jgi:hypothetical protein
MLNLCAGNLIRNLVNKYRGAGATIFDSHYSVTIRIRQGSSITKQYWHKNECCKFEKIV